MLIKSLSLFKIKKHYLMQIQCPHSICSRCTISPARFKFKTSV